VCGICGILRGGGRAAPGDARTAGAMADRLGHRGPDDAGVWSSGGMTFAFRRLAIIDREGGAQPMTRGGGRHAIVFNGEIYNYLELRQSLLRGGRSLETFSDTEVLLSVLAEHGAGGIDELNGMFAFAFADTEKREVLFARDHFGIKPLYVTTVRDGHGEAVLFASEIKAFYAAEGFEPRASWAGIEDYLTFQHQMNGESMFEGVRALPPGARLVWRDGVLGEPEWYWRPNYTIDDQHTETYFLQRVRFLLEDAARLQLRSDVPLGATLSGGLDSSTVACVAAQHTGGGLRVFHGRFAEGPAYDESSHARIAAERAGAEIFDTVPSESQFVEWMPELIYAMDEPAGGPGIFPQYAVARLASGHVTVTLSGHGGDELFGGYARYLVAYLEQALKGAIFETNEEGSHLVSLSTIIPNLPLLQEYAPLMRQFFAEGLFEPMDARYFRIVDRSPGKATLLTPDALARFDRERVFGGFRAVFNDANTKSYINKMTNFDLRAFLPALLQVEDRVTMACGLESRVPLLDRRIADLVCSAPPALKFQGGRGKHLLKEAVRGVVPDEIVDRRDKMGFPVPLGEWTGGDGPLRGFLGDVLLSKRARERGLLEPAAIEGLLDSGSRFGRSLWGALCLELWHLIHIDRALEPPTLPGRPG